MFPSSTSSSTQGLEGNGGGNGALTRYGSAPGSLLTATVQSASESTHGFSAFGTQNHLGPACFYPSKTSESTVMANQEDSASRKNNPRREGPKKANSATGLMPSYYFRGSGDACSSSSLVRHGSSPAGFVNQLATAVGDNNGFSITRSIGSYNSKGIPDNDRDKLGLNLQPRYQETFSRNYQETENGQRKSKHSHGGPSFGILSWDDNTHPLTFSVPPSKQAKIIDTSGVLNSQNTMDSQFQISLSHSAQEMASMEKSLNIPSDSIPCKIRAKRGCATHPRSIAERERRTRITGKLKKLHDAVPNMDKQTSYADMLDLAVQHIKGLQNKVQKLNNELESCTCGCKKTGGS